MFDRGKVTPQNTAAEEIPISTPIPYFGQVFPTIKPFLSQTVAEQVAAHLWREIEEGRINGIMPGVLKLESETGVNRKTVEAALQILERDGILKPQGAGKRRLIVGDQGGKVRLELRVGVFYFDGRDGGVDYILSLEHQLTEAGHTVIRAPDTLTRLRMDVGKVARLVGETQADAWVVIAASRECWNGSSARVSR